MKKSIGVIFGGQSVEHEVSIISGLQVVENLDSNKFNITSLYIDKDGFWYHGDILKKVEIFKEWDKNKKRAKQFFPTFDKKDKKNIINSLDAVVIAMHGNYGEDGKIQGLFEFLDIPYSSSGVVGSATGMDKIVMKKIFDGMGLPVLPYIWFNRDDFKNDKKEWINKIHYTLDYPVFVKPANLGSSIGISIAKNENELINSVEIASNYDKRIIVEKGIPNAFEVNCSAILKNGEILVSETEEPIKWEEFLSFKDKYIRGSGITKNEGMRSMSRKIPAEISDDLKKQIERYTKDIYKTMDCKGVVRVDYLLDNDKTKVFVNEINTIPGSFSFYLWEPLGIKFANLIELMIDEAILINKDKKSNITRYDSEILKKIGGLKGSKR